MYGKHATSMLNECFKNAPYIGRHQIHEDPERKSHKFYYIGHGDAFGVAMPESRSRWGFQIWGLSWVTGRSTKLDRAIKNAMDGKFPACRHNVQVEKRAKLHGDKFITPTWIHGEAPASFKKAHPAKLPIRGRGKGKGTRTRRQLKI